MNFGEGSEAISKEIYELLYKALNRVSESNSKKDALIAVIKFQLKILLIMGFCVELDTCLCCREQVLDEEMYFSSSMGGILCKECNEHLGVNLKMHHKIRDFLQAMLQFDFDFESDYDRKATEKVCQVCFNLLDEYIQTSKSAFGRGGMQTKCAIARKVADAGIAVWIANGNREGILTALVSNPDSACYTYFEPVRK